MSDLIPLAGRKVYWLPEDPEDESDFEEGEALALILAYDEGHPGETADMIVYIGRRGDVEFSPVAECTFSRETAISRQRSRIEEAKQKAAPPRQEVTA